MAGQNTIAVAVIADILILVLLVTLLAFKNKKQLHYFFLAYLAALFIWTTSVLCEHFSVLAGNFEMALIFENLAYVGISLNTVLVLFIGMSFVRTDLTLRFRHYLLFFVPALTQLVIWTNPLHHLFYVNYDFFHKSGIVVGPYFYVHTVYSYACLLIGIGYMVIFALKSSRAYLYQALLVNIGTLIPIAVNICYTMGIGNFNIFSTPIAFTLTIICYMVSVFLFDFLRGIPIILQTIVDRISDYYVVVDSDNVIIDYNKPFYDTFSALTLIKKRLPLEASLMGDNRLGIDYSEIKALIGEAQKSLQVVNVEYHLINDDCDRFFSVEFTPLIINKRGYATIILLKDITQAKRDMEEIRRNQEILVERERLASLGQLMGGMAHNLKTPIMSISGCVQMLGGLIEEYRASAGDAEVTIKDHLDIAAEMDSACAKIKTHMAYMSDIITAVKGQAVQFNSGSLESFTLGELMKRVDILMKYELIRHNCTLTINSAVDSSLEIGGSVNSLVQIFDNIIVNAIQAYDGQQGEIRLGVGLGKNNTIVFSIADDAGGMSKEVQEKLFKEMITTKGKNGTGLGLYISFSTVVGMFFGKMWFNTESGKGTEFFISIPLNPAAAAN